MICKTRNYTTLSCPDFQIVESSDVHKQLWIAKFLMIFVKTGLSREDISSQNWRPQDLVNISPSAQREKIVIALWSVTCGSESTTLGPIAADWNQPSTSHRGRCSRNDKYFWRAKLFLKEIYSGTSCLPLSPLTRNRKGKCEPRESGLPGTQEMGYKCRWSFCKYRPGTKPRERWFPFCCEADTI